MSSMSGRSDVSMMKRGINLPSASPRVAIEASETIGTGLASAMCRSGIDFRRQRLTAHAPVEIRPPLTYGDHKCQRSEECRLQPANLEGGQLAPRKGQVLPKSYVRLSHGADSEAHNRAR